MLDRESIMGIEKQIQEQKSDLDIIDFVRTLLKIIQCDQDETLYMTIALIDLFKEISEYSNSVGSIKISDITAYISDRILDKGGSYIIESKKLPPQKHFDVDTQNIREIDINAPVLYGKNNESIKIIQTQKLITDSIHHNNLRVKQGVYAKEIKKIFALDDLSQKINMFDIDCKLIKTLYPFHAKQQLSLDQQQNQQIILSFCWSERQQRLGSCLKDFHMAFWEVNDNFEFIKIINAHEQSIDIQTDIWFLEKLNIWITEDCKYVLNVWNLLNECIEYSIKIPNKKSFIFDIIELPLLNLAALGCQDKTINIYNIPKQHQVMTIKQDSGGVHSLKYFCTYEMLIIAGYLETINLYHIHLNYLDITQVGILKGHAKSVTAIEVIEQTPMVISADESGYIKLWDIRNLTCIQTISLGQKTLIIKLISIFSEAKICFLGTRVNMLNFEDPIDIQKKDRDINNEQSFPLEIELNENRNELIICTRKDLKIYDMSTGRMISSYIGLLENSEDEITIFKPIQFGQKFILSNQRGEINMYNLSLGEQLYKLQGHTNEVTCLKIDLKNQLIISTGWDNLLKIQMIQENNTIVIRELCNTHFNKPITILELSVHHNLIITASTQCDLYIWDYEFLKMLWGIQFNKGVEPTAISIINGYAVLIVSTNEGIIYFLHFQKKDLYLKIHLIGKINLMSYNSYYNDIEQQTFNQLVNFNNKKSDLLVLTKSPTILDDQKQKNGQKSPFLTTIQNQKCKFFPNGQKSSRQSKSDLSSPKSLTNEDDSPMANKYQDFMFATKMIVHIDINAKDMNQINFCKLIISSNKGEIYIFDLKNFLVNLCLPYVQHANTRPNYNPKRNAKEDFLFEQNKMKNDKIKLQQGSSIYKKTNQQELQFELNNDQRLDFELNQTKIASWYAHKDNITVLKIISLSEDNIVTGSMDGFVRFWTYRGSLISSVNLMYPLPNLWNIELNQSLTTKRKIIYAIRIIDVIFRKYGQNMHYLEEQKLNIQKFLFEIIQKYQQENQPQIMNKLKSQSSIIMPITQVLEPKINKQISNQRKKKVIIMQDEFQKKDLMFEKNRNLFTKEMQGQSLKQMDIYQRVTALQNRLKNSTDFDQIIANQELQSQNNQLFQNIQTEEKDNLPFFLNVNYRKNVIKPPQELFMDQFGLQDQFRKKFEDKLNNISKNVKKQFENKERFEDEKDQLKNQQKQQQQSQKISQQSSPHMSILNTNYQQKLQSSKKNDNANYYNDKQYQLTQQEDQKNQNKNKVVQNKEYQLDKKNAINFNKNNNNYDSIISPSLTQSKYSLFKHQKNKSQSSYFKNLDDYQIKNNIIQQKQAIKDFYQYAIDKNYISNQIVKPHTTEKDISLSDNKTNISQTKTIYNQGKLQSVLCGLDKKLRKSQQKFYPSNTLTSFSIKNNNNNFEDIYKDSSRDIFSPNSMNQTNTFQSSQVFRNSFSNINNNNLIKQKKSDNELIDYVLKTGYQSVIKNIKIKQPKKCQSQVMDD